MAYGSGNSIFGRSAKFFGEVKKEASSVVWPTKKETMIMTVVVCVFAFVMSAYLIAVDQVLIKVIRFIMG